MQVRGDLVSCVLYTKAVALTLALARLSYSLKSTPTFTVATNNCVTVRLRSVCFYIQVLFFLFTKQFLRDSDDH